MAELNDALNLGRRTRKHDHRRLLAQVRQRIALVRQQLHRFVQDGRVAADGAKPGKQPVVHEGNGTLRDWVAQATQPTQATQATHATATGLRNGRTARQSAR